jgi:Undecaprenyl-phosphate galactose phosphotransferase WbaP
MKITPSAADFQGMMFSGSTTKPARDIPTSWNMFKATNLKIVADLLMTVCLLVMLAPVMIGIAVLVALDGGPVLYKHMRVGKGGQRFYCLKFRSMVVSADDALAARLAGDPESKEEWLLTQKLKNDPRVTKVGHFLRATSLDELPQLFNVLRLEMSLVGPRPIVENELARYGRHIDYYLRTRPGLTGLWQVNGRSDTSYGRRVALDAWYVKSWRFWRDIGILFRTVPVVILRRGAH